jgi:hypothetical protein
MKQMKNTIISTIWFILEVILIFALVQAIRYAFGNWDALYIGLSLLAIALLLFFVAYISARIKDRRDGNKSPRVFTRILS